MSITKKYLLTFFILGVFYSLFLLYKTFHNEIVKVSADLSELSGFEFDHNQQLWGINDSGNPPEIYQIDSTGNIHKTIKITNAKNIDWEDMTQDDLGNFYIGDFGNNLNKRKNLTIYKIKNPSHINGNTTKAEIIHFNFKDQLSFPAPEAKKNFDLEAFLQKRTLPLYKK